MSQQSNATSNTPRTEALYNAWADRIEGASDPVAAIKLFTAFVVECKAHARQLEAALAKETQNKKEFERDWHEACDQIDASYRLAADYLRGSALALDGVSPDAISKVQDYYIKRFEGMASIPSAIPKPTEAEIEVARENGYAAGRASIITAPMPSPDKQQSSHFDAWKLYCEAWRECFPTSALQPTLSVAALDVFADKLRTMPSSIRRSESGEIFLGENDYREALLRFLTLRTDAPGFVHDFSLACGAADALIDESKPVSAIASSPDGFNCQKPSACTNPACSCPVV